MAPKKICIKDSVIDTLLISSPYFNDGELHYKGEVSYILESEHNRIVDELKAELNNALESLCTMYAQYCSGEGGHLFMSAGEGAVEILERNGLFDEKSAYGTGEFTAKAIELMGWNPNNNKI